MKNYLLKPAYSLVVVCLCLPVGTAFAQKLANVQNKSIWMQGLKVDGRSADWRVPLQAANRSTGLLYTLANDDKNLYVMIRSADDENNAKILLGGITFTVNIKDKKKREGACSVTFPLIKKGQADLRRAAKRGRGDKDMTERQQDSVQTTQGNQQLAALRDIGVTGFKAIPDSAVSIYNMYGLKAAARFNSKSNYLYELAIPLKLLGLPPGHAKEFAYNLRVNGLQEGDGGFGRRLRGFGRGNIGLLDMLSPTDFWGRYTPAKKNH